MGGGGGGGLFAENSHECYRKEGVTQWQGMVTTKEEKFDSF